MKSDSATVTAANNTSAVISDLNKPLPSINTNDKAFLSGSSDLSVSNQTNGQITYLPSSNSNRNIINHFFSQVNTKSFKTKSYKPIIKQEQPIIITPVNTNHEQISKLPTPPNAILTTPILNGNSINYNNNNSMQFNNRPNSTTQITIQELQINKNVNGSSRNQSKINHVHFTTPLTANPPLPNATVLSSSTNTTNNLLPLNYSTTPPNTSSNPNTNLSTSNNNSGFHSASVNKLSSSQNGRIGANCNNNVPLKNISTIRSNSFRHKNLNSNSKQGMYQSTTQLAALNPMPISKDTSKSFENLSNSLKNENNSIDSNKKEENTHNFNRLVKIASNWHSKSRSSSTASNYQQSKVIDRGLISQSKIRQTQMFLNDSLEYANSESALSRKMAELCELSPSLNYHKYNYNTDDPGYSLNDKLNRTKSLRIKTSQKLIAANRPMNDSVNDLNKIESNEAYSNINYWKPNETTTNTLVSENGDKSNDLQSGRNSFIYSRKSSRSIEVVNLNQKGTKLTGTKVFQKYANPIGNSNGNNSSKGDTPQLNKLAQYAIEIQ